MLIDAPDVFFYGPIARTRDRALIPRGSKLRIQLNRIIADAARKSSAKKP
jgi:hypothetical protein